MKFILKKILVFIFLIFSFFQAFAGDGTITNLSLQKYLKVNVYSTAAARIINTSGTAITSYKTGWKLDNGAPNISGLINIGGGGLPTGGSYMNFTQDVRPTTQGLHVLKIWVKATGDTNAANDTLTFNFTALSINNYTTKVNLFEESTGTWCQYCPEGAAAIATIKPLPNTAIAVFHTGDIYETPEGETYFNAYFPGNIFTPGAMINMSENNNYIINTQRTAWLQDMNNRANSISPAQFTINPTYNVATRQLSVSIVTNFKYVENGDYYTNLYIVENGIVGTQVNATNPYTHDNVVRKMLGGSDGTSGIIPFTPVLNTDYTNSYDFTIPTTWNVNNLTIIGMVYKKIGAYRNTLNAAKYEFSTLLATTDFGISPNPAHNFITISDVALNIGDKVSVYNLNGQLLVDEELNPESPEINISSLPTGIYMLKVKTDQGILTKKFIKE